MISRRGLLRALPAMAGAGVGGRIALGADAGHSGVQVAPSGRLGGLPSGFSLAERDRRWARVRAMMRQASFDCLLTPAAAGDADADSRYLTGHRGWVVFPQAGPVTLVRDRDGEGPVPWVSDVRDGVLRNAQCGRRRYGDDAGSHPGRVPERALRALMGRVSLQWQPTRRRQTTRPR